MPVLGQIREEEERRPGDEGREPVAPPDPVDSPVEGGRVAAPLEEEVALARAARDQVRE